MVVASGSNPACPPSAGGLGSSPFWKYASPRPRTWTSRVLKPPAFAAETIVAIAAGEVSVVRTTHSARTSVTGSCARNGQRRRRSAAAIAAAARRGSR
jgi:hypothetical protein